MAERTEISREDQTAPLGFWPWERMVACRKPLGAALTPQDRKRQHLTISCKGAAEVITELKKFVVTSALTLFQDGALIASIPAIEVVDNHKLLGSFATPKLLSAPEVQPGDGKAPAEERKNTKTPKRKPPTDDGKVKAATVWNRRP